MVTLDRAAASGVGIYTTSEAALYARMPTRTLTDWFFNACRYRRPQIDEDERVIGFLDLIEAIAIRDLRYSHGISFKKIQQAVDNAKRFFDSDYPFADENHRPIKVGSELYIIHKELPDSAVAVSGKEVGQLSSAPLLESWIEDVVFKDGIASAYKAFQHRDEEVVLDPTKRFGSPLISSCGYSADTLWKAAMAEGSYKAAAEEYGVSVTAVEAAVKYFTKDLNLAA